MRGRGQIAELCEIAEPDVAAITNIGPVHLELLGTLEAIAEAKAEILAELRERGRAVVPADAEALEPHLHDRLVTITFGAGGDVFALEPERRRALDRGHDRHAGRRAALLVPVRGGAQPAQRAGGDRDRRGARGAAGRDGAAGAGDNLLAPARRADRAGRRNRRRERLLQRQPDLDARGARSPGLARGGRPPRRGARRDGGAGPERRRLSPRGRGPRAPARRRADPRGWRARPRLRARRLGARRRGGGPARRGDARAGRRGAGQGLALGRPRAGHRRADRAAGGPRGG